MSDLQTINPAAEAPRFNPRAFVLREWPYLLVLVLALFGIAYTSFSHTPMTIYWIVLAPLIGVICVVTRWRDFADRSERMRLIWTQALHWAAVIVAMHLIFVTDVARMLNTDAAALAELTLLALGTFTAGLHIGAWRICVVGVLMAAGVPGIAWLEQSALLLVLVALVVAAVIAPFVWRGWKGRKTSAETISAPTQL
jgi:hypothetical protein